MLILKFMPKTLTPFRAYNSIFPTNLSSSESRVLRLKSCISSAHTDIPALQNRFNSLNKVSYFCTTAIRKKSTTARSESSKSSFQQKLHLRKKQAQCSVLIELNKKEDIPYALKSCEQFGVIKNAYSYCGVSENVFLLLEFDEEGSTRKLLLSSHYKNISDAFPVFSRIVGYTRKYEQEEPKTSVNVIEDVPSTPSSKQRTVSDLIEDIYMTERLSELNVRLRFFFGCVLKELVSGPFPFCDAIPFGSSVNGIGRHGCDLDLMMRLYPEEIHSNSELYFVNKTCVGDIQNLQRKVVYCIADLLRTFSPGVATVQKILNARVPIVKLDHRILGMKVDISINNMAPTLMSEMLYFCGEVDSRIRPLIFAVKKWAREASITYESPGSWITNFALTLLVIFFLQNRPSPILPPMIEAINIKGAEYTPEYKLEYLMPLSELQAKASLNKESLAFLLKEFLTYLGSHPFENKHISLLSGIATEDKTDSPLWVQYPLEEGFNVSKNVSEFELSDMCEKARVSAKYLGSCLNSKVTPSKDLSVLLGIPVIRKLDVNKSKRIDVSSLLGEEVKSLNKKSGRRQAF